MQSLTHPQRVRWLYKTILRLHRGLPGPMRVLGDSYVRDEFKRHKAAAPEFVPPFMMEWSKYAANLAEQLRHNKHTFVDSSRPLGSALDELSLNNFSPEQLSQLLELADSLHISPRTGDSDIHDVNPEKMNPSAKSVEKNPQM